MLTSTGSCDNSRVLLNKRFLKTNRFSPEPKVVAFLRRVELVAWIFACLLQYQKRIILDYKNLNKNRFLVSHFPSSYYVVQVVV
jgi:hypothetical protein